MIMIFRLIQSQTGLDGQLVAAVVFRCGAVTAHPFPFDRVRLHRRQQRTPQIIVFDRLFTRRTPAIELPLIKPTVGESPFQILRVGHDTHPAGPAQRPQALERGCQFHPVVGGFRVGPAQFAAMPPVPRRDEHHTPAAFARIG